MTGNHSTFDGDIFLHVGPHKTGTTTVQRYFSDSEEDLSGRGALFPKSGRGSRGPNQHWTFCRSVIKKNDEELGRFFSDLNEEIEQVRPSKILISTEVLSRNAADLDRLRLFGEHYPESRIFILFALRKPDNFLVSHSAENVKKGGRRLGLSENRLSELDAVLDNCVRIDKLLAACPGAVVVLIPFERHKGNLVESFYRILGVEDCPVPAREGQSNTSLSWGWLSLLEIVNKLPQKLASRLRVRMVRFAKRHPSLVPNKPPFSKEQLEFVRSRYAPTNGFIQEVFFDGEDIGLGVYGTETLENSDRAKKYEGRVVGFKMETIERNATLTG